MNPKNENHTSRRHFIRQSACAALGYTGLVNALTQMSMVNSATAQAAPTGYKALVVLFMFGGNDSANMLIPRMNHPYYSIYKESRQGLRILDPMDPDRTASSTVSVPITTVDGSYGVHPSSPQLADLFHQGDLSFVANVGSLRYPIVTRDVYRNGLIPIPEGLFGHEVQQAQWQSSLPDQPLRSGWGGRIADLLGKPNPDSISMSITLDGFNVFQRGMLSTSGQFALSSQGSINLEGYGTNYAQALNADGTYKTSLQGKRLKAFEDIMRTTYSNLLQEGYNGMVRESRAYEAIVGSAINAAGSSGVNFDNIFGTDSSGDLSNQLKMIAKLIAGRSVLDNTRQIFFCAHRGFDTHAYELEAHASLMQELGEALAAFKTSLVQLGVFDDVLLISKSDFGRSLTPNKPDADSAGSDHAWGGHHLVMGGGVHGGRIFGEYPNLTVGGISDSGDRGRYIPTTSVDQYSAVAAKWFGVANNELSAIFPNLYRFDDPFGTSANVRYIG